MITDDATAALQTTEKKLPIKSLTQTILMHNADIKGNILEGSHPTYNHIVFTN